MITTPLFEIDPQQIRIAPVPSFEMVALQNGMSRATWRPYGRRLAFKVIHEYALLGIVLLTNPVITLGVRDRAFNFPADGVKRGTVLRQYADMSVCVGAQPISWYWNLGKLVAMVATTLGDEWTQAYGDPLLGVFTTSLWGAKWGGKGTQYSRIYKYLGETKGFGHEHVPEAAYQAMLRWMRLHHVEIPGSSFADPSNPRMRRILAYRKASGDTTATVFHGNQRGVYYAPARPTAEREQVIQEWYTRWGHPLYLRVRDQAPPYQSGLEVAA
jgi:hypothetical protein